MHHLGAVLADAGVDAALLAAASAQVAAEEEAAGGRHHRHGHSHDQLVCGEGERVRRATQEEAKLVQRGKHPRSES